VRIKILNRNILILCVLLAIICVSIIIYKKYSINVNKYSDDNAINNKNIIFYDTVKLPLKISSIKMPLEFIHGAGSIGSCNDSLIIMDRTGKFFQLINGEIVTMNGPRVPSNRDLIIKDIKLEDNLNLLRALSFQIRNNAIYASYQRYLGNGESQIVLSKSKINCETQKIEKWIDLKIFNQIKRDALESAGMSGKFSFKSDDLVTISIGNSSSDLPYIIVDGQIISKAQNDDQMEGKIFLLELSTSSLSLIAKGFRNIQGMYYDKKEDKLLTVEHGPLGGDEINIIYKNGNYGWPLITEGVNYGNYSLFNNDQKVINPVGKFIDPIYSFVPSAGISSIIKLNSFNERWKDNFLVGSLKAGTIFRTKIIDSKLLFLEPISLNKRIRDLVEINDTIFALTDDGYLLSLKVDNEKLENNKRGEDSLFVNQIISERCFQCHGLSGYNQNTAGPSLWKIYGRKIAADLNFKYSKNLSNNLGIWDEEMLIELLTKKDSVRFSGINMPYQNLSKKEAMSVIEALRKQ
jgi:glucose/arabinose dehydrogenase/cytochrome c2